MEGGYEPITHQGHAVPQGGEGRGGGTPLPLRSWVPLGLAGNDERDHKNSLSARLGHPIMNPEQEKLLEDFESFELDLEVEAVLKKVEKEHIHDEGIVQFAEQLERPA